MSICDDVVAFVDGELTDERAAAYRQHLLTCGRCRVLVVSTLQLDARLADLHLNTGDVDVSALLTDLGVPDMPPGWEERAVERARAAGCFEKSRPSSSSFALALGPSSLPDPLSPDIFSPATARDQVAPTSAVLGADGVWTSSCRGCGAAYGKCAAPCACTCGAASKG